MNETVFRKSYEACGPVYVPIMGRFYLEPRCESFSEHIGDLLGNVYDCFNAALSAAHNEITKIFVSGLQGVLPEEEKTFLDE